MFDYLMGKVADKIANGHHYKIILDVNGIGYEIAVSQNTFNETNKIGLSEKLFIHMNVQQNGIQLVGFKNMQEREFYKELLTVQGLGNVAVLKMLSQASPAQIIEAIQKSDIDFLCSITSKKNAEMTILKLKKKKGALVGTGLEILSNTNVQLNAIMQGAVDTLCTLGMSKKEAESAIVACYKKDTKNSAELVKDVLKQL